MELIQAYTDKKVMGKYNIQIQKDQCYNLNVMHNIQKEVMKNAKSND